MGGPERDWSSFFIADSTVVLSFEDPPVIVLSFEDSLEARSSSGGISTRLLFTDGPERVWFSFFTAGSTVVLSFGVAVSLVAGCDSSQLFSTLSLIYTASKQVSSQIIYSNRSGLGRSPTFEIAQNLFFQFRLHDVWKFHIVYGAERFVRLEC